MWTFFVLKVKENYYLPEKKQQKPYLLSTLVILRETELCSVRTPTSRSFLFTFLSLLPLCKFSKCFSSFLKFGNKIFNVIQNMVQNLLQEKNYSYSIETVAVIFKKSKELYS